MESNSSTEEVYTNLTDETKLSEMFDSAFEIFNNLNRMDEPTNSTKVQSTVKSTIKVLEDATRLVSLANIFSNNESFEEIPTENIKYFLLPALLGTLVTKLCDTTDRIQIVDTAEVYFVDFLTRLKLYGLIDIDIPDSKQTEEVKELGSKQNISNAESITKMVITRNTKIQRYQQQKELEKKLNILKESLKNPNIDDESKRQYFVTLLQIFANQAIDEINSLSMERPLLERMKEVKCNTKDDKIETDNYKGSISTLKPIIITRDALQKKVYGAGYPSLPVLTVQEFYDKKVKDGEWLEQTSRNQIGSISLQDAATGKNVENLEKVAEEEKKEKEIEDDDPIALEKSRAMDEYKDDHKRGWGNRANRS